jgi:hypothetical protein
MRAFIVASLLCGVLSGSCFPAFSDPCCDALASAEADVGLSQAEKGLVGVIGEAEDEAFQRCRSSLAPCQVRLENTSQYNATCCEDDARDGWTKPRPAAAVAAVKEAGGKLQGGGAIWWVMVNQTDFSAGKVERKTITHQYPNWFPSACNDAKAIGEFENMMCNGGSAIECHCSASRATN